MKDLKLLNNQELEDFFNSFDLVLSDVDGVLWLATESIPGTADSINSLKKIGKRVVFVSNNSTKTSQFYYEELKSAGFDIEPNEIIIPALAMISYLQKQNINKQLFVKGTSSLKKELENAGFQIADDPPRKIQESVGDFARLAFDDDGKHIGAVILDADFNFNYLKLQRAANYLQNPDVLFITGASDKKLPIGLNHVFIGPGHFNKVLEDVSGRKGYCLAKPSTHFNDFIIEKLHIKDSSKVLFIGDSILEDMGFATNCGYKKLLVFSGLAKKNCVESWTYPEEFKPDYYVDSLKTIHSLISSTFSNKF